METAERTRRSQSPAGRPLRSLGTPTAEAGHPTRPAPAPALPLARCPPSAAESGSEGFWRPWLGVPGENKERVARHPAQAVLGVPRRTEASGKLSHYQHPVRLFWPKSKCYDYLYQEAETLLKNFPIQATISFYEDSDSEDEVEELSCENQSN